MTPAREEAQRLLRLALRDSDTFELLLPLPQAGVAAIGFHAQQSIEKALKSIGTLHGLEVRRKIGHPHRTVEHRDERA